LPSWNELLTEFDALPSDDARAAWLLQSQQQSLGEIGHLRGDRHVLLYASAFLQKPQAPSQAVQLTHEDLNGFMSVVFGMDWSKGVTLLLHTPGGVTNAAETVVSYLRSKFSDVEVVVPAFAMSAGTMIALASDRIIMGRQSQLGPIDPQMPIRSTGQFVSAQAIVEQFERGRNDILGNVTTAHVWAPILQSLGPALLQEAQNALDYGERMVAEWLGRYMFRGRRQKSDKAKMAARYFNDARTHKSHGRRIDRDEARSHGIRIEDLESDQDLQDKVLTAYHLATITFEKSPAARFIASDTGRLWIKNWQ
jgi:hypothetical protein